MKTKCVFRISGGDGTQTERNQRLILEGTAQSRGLPMKIAAKIRGFGRALVVSGLIVLGLPSVASAKCSNLCDLTVESLTVEPPLACATVSKAFEQTCSCEVRFDVNNGRDCESPVQTKGFEFEVCLPSGPEGESSCSELPPAHQGVVIFPLTQIGETRRSFSLQDGDGEHRVEVVAHVARFGDSGGGCSVAGTPNGYFGWWALSTLATLSHCLWRRTRGRVG